MSEFVWAMMGFVGGIVFSILGLFFSRSRDHYKDESAQEGTLSYAFSKFWGFIDQILFTPIFLKGKKTEIRDFDKTIVKVGPNVTQIITFRRLLPFWPFMLLIFGSICLMVIVSVLAMKANPILGIVLSVFAIGCLLFGFSLYMLLFETASTEHNFQLDGEKFIWKPGLLRFSEGYTPTNEIDSIRLLNGKKFFRLWSGRRIEFPARVLTIRNIHGDSIDIFAIPTFINDRFGDPISKLQAELMKTLDEFRSAPASVAMKPAEV